MFSSRQRQASVAPQAAEVVNGSSTVAQRSNAVAPSPANTVHPAAPAASSSSSSSPTAPTASFLANTASSSIAHAMKDMNEFIATAKKAVGSAGSNSNPNSGGGGVGGNIAPRANAASPKSTPPPAAAPPNANTRKVSSSGTVASAYASADGLGAIDYAAYGGPTISMPTVSASTVKNQHLLAIVDGLKAEAKELRQEVDVKNQTVVTLANSLYESQKALLLTKTTLSEYEEQKEMFASELVSMKSATSTTGALREKVKRLESDLSAAEQLFTAPLKSEIEMLRKQRDDDDAKIMEWKTKVKDALKEGKKREGALADDREKLKLQLKDAKHKITEMGFELERVNVHFKRSKQCVDDATMTEEVSDEQWLAQQLGASGYTPSLAATANNLNLTTTTNSLLPNVLLSTSVGGGAAGAFGASPVIGLGGMLSGGMRVPPAAEALAPTLEYEPTAAAIANASDPQIAAYAVASFRLAQQHAPAGTNFLFSGGGVIGSDGTHTGVFSSGASATAALVGGASHSHDNAQNSGGGAAVATNNSAFGEYVRPATGGGGGGGGATSYNNNAIHTPLLPQSTLLLASDTVAFPNNNSMAGNNNATSAFGGLVDSPAVGSFVDPSATILKQPFAAAAGAAAGGSRSVSPSNAPSPMPHGGAGHATTATSAGGGRVSATSNGPISPRQAANLPVPTARHADPASMAAVVEAAQIPRYLYYRPDSLERSLFLGLGPLQQRVVGMARAHFYKLLEGDKAKQLLGNSSAGGGSGSQHDMGISSVGGHYGSFPLPTPAGAAKSFAVNGGMKSCGVGGAASLLPPPAVINQHIDVLRKKTSPEAATPFIVTVRFSRVATTTDSGSPSTTSSAIGFNNEYDSSSGGGGGNGGAWSLDAKMLVRPGMTTFDLIVQCCSKFSMRYESTLEPTAMALAIHHDPSKRRIVLAPHREVHSYAFIAKRARDQQQQQQQAGGGGGANSGGIVFSLVDANPSADSALQFMDTQI